MDLENKSPLKANGQIASCLEYACLDADVTNVQLRMVCAEAEKFGINSVLINPVHVSETVGYLSGTKIKTNTVIAYPIGAYPPQIKQFEVQDALENGANGIALLMAVGRFMDGFYDDIRAEMDLLAGLPEGTDSRLMIEANALPFEQRLQICQMAADAGVHKILTSTGFERGGFFELDVEDVKHFAQAVGGLVEIHALKRQTTLPEVLAYSKAGARQIITASVREVMDAYRDEIRDVIP